MVRSEVGQGDASGMPGPSDLLTNVWIVGPGRLGLALGGRIAISEDAGRVTFVGRSVGAPDHPVFSSPNARYANDPHVAEPNPTLVLLTVPDGAIAAVSGELAPRLARSRNPAPVLHASGALGTDVLGPFAERGHPVGSIHPLVAVSDREDSAGRLGGAWYGIGGDPEAIRAAEQLVALVKGQSLRVEPSKRPGYHAAAVFASNYVVSLLSVAEELLADAGVERADARRALTDLARGAVDAVAASSPVAALTGPITRGDDATLTLHLGGLSAETGRLYSELGRTTLGLAIRRGLGSEASERIVAALEPGGQ